MDRSKRTENPFDVPLRRGSIQGTTAGAVAAAKRKLEEDRAIIQAEIRSKKSKLKPQGSFSAEYWLGHAHVSNLEQQRVRLTRKISISEFGGSEAAWDLTDKAMDLFAQEKALEADEKIFRSQAKTVTSSHKSDDGSAARRSFVSMFTTSFLGLGISSEVPGSGQGRRRASDQSLFRAQLIQEYSSLDPNPDLAVSWIWCPILHRYFQANVTVAAHLFSYKHGQDTMTAIFGPQETPELFSPRNGCIWSTLFEDVFDIGLLAIVPDISSDSPSEKEILAWNASSPKNYKIKILDNTLPAAKKIIDRDCPEVRWEHMDEKPLKFLSDFRPRARYIYFHYLLQMLRVAWRKSKNPEWMKRQQGKRYWGTVGAYIPKYMLRGFIDEIGENYAFLMQNGYDEVESTPGDKYLVIKSMTSHIKRTTLGGEEIPGKEDEDEGEDGDELEYRE